MKALSIQEPWATFIRSGRKTIETRTWKTKFRGRILLCASKTPKGSYAGMAFAVATLADCRPMMHQDQPDACCEIYDRANAWILTDVEPIEPFPVKGQLGLFEVEYNER